MDKYLEALQIDKDVVQTYYLRDIETKSEQQKFLERILKESTGVKSVLDAGCGGGGTSYHLHEMYPDAAFTLIDYNVEALNIAKEVTSNFNAKCYQRDIYQLSDYHESYDLVVCMQTLLIFDDPFLALEKLVKTCRKGGKIILCSLFNEYHDVDIESNIVDYTRKSSEKVTLTYKTLALSRIIDRFKSDVRSIKYHPFDIGIDIPHKPKGLGTYTHLLANGARLQVSGGLLMNWGFLEIDK